MIECAPEHEPGEVILQLLQLIATLLSDSRRGWQATGDSIIKYREPTLDADDGFTEITLTISHRPG